MEYTNFMDWVEKQYPSMIQTLETFVNIDSRSYQVSGTQHFLKLFADRLEKLSFQIDWLKGGIVQFPSKNHLLKKYSSSDHLLAHSKTNSKAPSILLMGHADTVYSPFQFQLDESKHRAIGSGVTDMKGGLTVLLFMIEMLHTYRYLDLFNWTILINTDEEVASLNSRPYIEQYAPGHDLCLVFEPTSENKKYVQSRKGVGYFQVAIYGKSAHAGRNHHEGLSAIRELARKIELIESATDYSDGMTFNVGIINGGEAKNSIPDFAECFVDLRYQNQESIQEKYDNLIQKIKQPSFVNERIQESFEIKVTGGLTRPPKPFTSKSQQYFQLLNQCSQELFNERIDWVESGGGSDGNIVQSCGVDVLDTMGVDGGKIHTLDEYIELDSLKNKTLLNAIFLLKWRQQFRKSYENV